jgi:hypothetical protein
VPARCAGGGPGASPAQLGNSITKSAQDPSVGSFSANVGLGRIIFSWNVGTKPLCSRAGRFMFSRRYSYDPYSPCIETSKTEMERRSLSYGMPSERGRKLDLLLGTPPWTVKGVRPRGRMSVVVSRLYTSNGDEPCHPKKQRRKGGSKHRLASMVPSPASATLAIQ